MTTITKGIGDNISLTQPASSAIAALWSFAGKMILEGRKAESHTVAKSLKGSI